MNSKIFTLVITLISFNISAALNVVTSTPDIAYMVKELGGKLVKVESLLDGTEDPHYVDAMPHFIAKASQADIFCQVGMSLEAGWVPKLLQRSGNRKIQSGGKGHCIAGKNVKAIEIPQGRIDRSMGDVHPEGNPHFHLGPKYFLQGASAVLEILIDNDPKNASVYLNNYANLEKKIKKIKVDISKLLNKIKNKNFLQYHREFSYFFKEYGLNDRGALEATPGIPPSAGRLARVAVDVKTKKIAAVLGTPTTPEKLLLKFKQMTKIPYTLLPLGIVSKRIDGPHNYRQLQLAIAKSILKIQ